MPEENNNNQKNEEDTVPKKKRSKKSKKLLKKISAIIVLVAILSVVLYFAFKTLTPEEAIATVNGEIITKQELNQKYDQLPDQYKLFITKEDFLDQIINIKLLLQEAKEQEITVDESEIETELENLKKQAPTEEAFEQLLGQRNIGMEELKNQIKDQLTINKLLDETVISKIEVTDSQMKQYYEENIEEFKTEEGDTITYEESKDQIEQFLLAEVSNNAIEIYINQLKSNAEITKEGTKESPKEEVEEPAEETEETTEEAEAISEIETFTETKEEICKEDGKIIIRLFSTTKNKASNWISSTFDDLAKDNKNIILYHWQLDTGDNTLTATKEKGIPKKEVELFKKLNPKSTVPTYVFGCKYVRTGNAFDSLEEEKAEFDAVIEQLS